MSTAPIELNRSWKLPPLILHPFADPGAPEKLVESSRANLLLHGVAPTEFTVEELDWKLLQGRYYEIRMLYYVGKDLARWIEQCMEFVDRDEGLRGLGIRPESFASMLVEDPPPAVKDKLRNWGVEDYRAIFSRAIGLYAAFGVVPERETVSAEFLRNYYRFADYLFACHQQLAPFPLIRSRNFEFELYASGEYTRMLERQWET
jgi:hypothetical protein